MALQCKICDKTFKGGQGLASHMRWHRFGKRGGEATPTTRPTKKVRARALGPMQEQFITALEQFPEGGTCTEIATEMQKNGFKTRMKRASLAARVSSVASNMFNRKEVLRTGRGVYRAKTSSPMTPTRHPSPQSDAADQLTAPKLPVEALHVQLAHMDGENRRLRQVVTILMSGD